MGIVYQLIIFVPLEYSKHSLYSLRKKQGRLPRSFVFWLQRLFYSIDLLIKHLGSLLLLEMKQSKMQLGLDLMWA